MINRLKYVPVLRVRQEEIKVLKSFDFGQKIWPCLEIIKANDRLLPQVEGKDKKKGKAAKDRTFEEAYTPLILGIKSKHVFIDLPLHLKPEKTMKPDTISFLQNVVLIRSQRTAYIKSLSVLAPKVIPIISSYGNITGEKGTIMKQEEELRLDFKIIGFRTFMNTFNQDILQIEKVVKKTDYLIMDWDNNKLDLSDGDQEDIVDQLNKLECNVIVHRNCFHRDITNVSLVHGEIIEEIDNCLVEIFKNFGGNCFSDYGGIKKDYISGGGIISPGFAFYDAVKNRFYGFRYEHGGHKKDEVPPKLDEFETRIVPAVINSHVSTGMHKHELDFLGEGNKGWQLLNRIYIGDESGRSAPKFKRIGIEHYLYCIKTRIENGDFD